MGVERSYLLANMTEKEILGFMKQTEIETYEKGEILFQEGDSGNAMYLIDEGEVEVLKHVEGERFVLLTTLGEGHFFGEMSMFQRNPRSATIRAKKPLRVIKISYKILIDELMERPLTANKILHAMAKVYTKRLRFLNIIITSIALEDQKIV